MLWEVRTGAQRVTNGYMNTAMFSWQPLFESWMHSWHFHLDTVTVLIQMAQTFCVTASAPTVPESENHAPTVCTLLPTCGSPSEKNTESRWLMNSGFMTVKFLTLLCLSTMKWHHKAAACHNFWKQHCFSNIHTAKAMKKPPLSMPNATMQLSTRTPSWLAYIAQSLLGLGMYVFFHR